MVATPSSKTVSPSTSMSSSRKDFRARGVTQLHAGEWCCESALWLADVVHFGSLVANIVSDVLSVDAARFAEVTEAHRLVTRTTARYAEEYTGFFNMMATSNQISDLP